MMAPHVTWSVRALGWARRRLLRGRGRVCLLRSRSSPSPWVRRDGDRLLRPRSSPSPGSGEVEFVVFRGRGRVRALGRARRSSSSSGAEAESEPWVGRGRVRRLPGPSPSLSPGSGEAEFVVLRGRARVRALGRARQSSSSSRAEPESEPWVGRGGVRRLPGPSSSPSPRSGEAEFLMAPEAGLGRCQPHSIEWHSSRSDAGGAVFLSDWTVERRSDCVHFGSVD
jgi:hypothetical protein